MPALAPKDQRSRISFLPSTRMAAKVTIDAAYMASNGVTHSFFCAGSLVGVKSVLYKRYSTVFVSPSGIWPFS
jgi:hypothetical protein